MSKKRRQDPEVNGLYQMNQSNPKRDNQATKHAFKTVGITAIVLLVVFFGYRLASGQGLNPFHSASPQTTQQSSSSQPQPQPKEHPTRKVDKKTLASATIEHVYDGMNHLANGYGDTNQVRKPLATYFVKGQKNASYQSSYRWTDQELGNYHTRTANLTPGDFKIEGNRISYQVKSVYVLARGNRSRATTKWSAELKMVNGHYKIVKMMAHK